MEQKQAALLEDGSDVRDHYCNLNPVLIAICCGPRTSRQEIICIDKNDDLLDKISSAAVYFSGALLPLLHGQVEVRNTSRNLQVQNCPLHQLILKSFLFQIKNQTRLRLGLRCSIEVYARSAW